MYNKMLSGSDLHELFSSGYRNLKKNMDAVNNLNVFPVPDGDTGTNMVQTFGGGLRAVSGDITHAGDYMQKLSKAVLLSARGNSGVIFSQFVHGLARGFADKATVSFHDFAAAFTCAREDAYSAIISPAEGTILTLIREGADFLAENVNHYEDPQHGFEALLGQLKISLAHTPELLPVLKEAGVVDSGGAGLVCFIEGMYAQLCGEDIEDTADILDTIAATHVDASNFGPDSVLEYGYCTEFILQLMNYKTDIANFDQAGFIAELEKLGDSIVCVKSDSIVKIHVHTFTPEKALELGRRYGEFLTIKIENMSVQHSEVQAPVPEKKKVRYAFIPVASGQGIVDYFMSIGASAVVSGGQTNNPSVDDFLDTFAQFEAEHIIVLPNNSNIIFTANQAAELYKDAPVHVIPTRSVMEGYGALSMANPFYDTVEELLDDMTMGTEGVTTAYVTTAIRDTHMDGLDVKKGQYIGLSGKHLIVNGEEKLAVAEALVRKLAAPRQEIIMGFCGSSMTESEVGQLRDTLQEAYPHTEIAFIDGQQDVYDLILSL